MRKIYKKLHKLLKLEIAQLLLISLLLLAFNVILYKLFSVRSLSFGCFDDCANYMAGYFMAHGKILYTEISYNHLLGMAWLSFFIQKIHPGINIYDLVLTHRQVIMAIAFILDVLIIKKFKWSGVLFVMFYELSKFYVFGDRFLGESIVVYLVVYMSGIFIRKAKGLTVSMFDYLLCGLFAAVIIVTREPYIPLAVIMYGAILFGKLDKRKTISIVAFLLVALVVALNTNFNDLYFNDYVVNSTTAIKSEADSNKLFGLGIFPIIFSPIFVFIYGKLNIFRFFEMAISIAFLVGIAFEVIKQKKYSLSLLLVLFLALSNIRITPPGTTYYEAYHIMVWFGLLLFLSISLSFEVYQIYAKKGLFLIGIIGLGFIVSVFGPSSYIYDKLDLQSQLLTNFGNVMNVGNVVSSLSSKNDTLFLDGGDDMIYWQSGLFSPYKYSWYTTVMPQIPLYKQARIEMFQNSAPTFYYDFCSKEAPLNPSLPSFVKNKYQQLYSNGKPSCLYVLKSKLPNISAEQWSRAKNDFYELPVNK